MLFKNTGYLNKPFQSARKRRLKRFLLWGAGLFTLSLILLIIDFKGVLRSYQYRKQLEIFINETDFKTGDLLFRRGNSFESLMVMMLDRNGEYSHIGVILHENDTAWVVHMEPGKDKNGNEYIRKEPVSLFLAPEKSTQYALFRINHHKKPDLRQVKEYIKDAITRQCSFDHSYDHNDEEKLYCSELIRNAYIKGGVDLVSGEFDILSVFSINIPVILPSSLIGKMNFDKIAEYP